MKKIIFETSTERASIGFMENGALTAQENFFGGPGLSEKLAPFIKNFIDETHFSCDEIILGIGPGSFTGIRVGAALALSLSFGWGVPLYTAPSLAAFAAPSNLLLAVLVDARSGGFYAYLSDEKNPFLLPVDDAPRVLARYTQFASPHPEKIQKRFNPVNSLWLDLWPDLTLLSKAATLHPSGAPLSPIYLENPR